MQDILIRIEFEDYEKWLEQHNLHAQNRRAHGIEDGPVYRDVATPHAALFHIRAADMERAMQWFGSDTFKQATGLATVTGREFYLATRRN